MTVERRREGRAEREAAGKEPWRGELPPPRVCMCVCALSCHHLILSYYYFYRVTIIITIIILLFMYDVCMCLIAENLFIYLLIYLVDCFASVKFTHMYC